MRIRGRGSAGRLGGVLVLVTVVVLAVSPSAPATLLSARGSFEGDGYVYPSSNTCTMDLNFRGRMPDGYENRIAFFGSMTRSQYCFDPSFAMTMHATTPGGYFDWSCSGGAINEAMACVTHQTGGSFWLRLTISAVPAEDNPPYWSRTVYRGTYEANIG